jgi:hypothetical protein
MNETAIPNNQNPVDEAEREAALAAPFGYAPSYADLLEAVKAYMLWHVAEDKNLGTFHAKMDLCSYAEWAGKKALGLPHAPEWKGVPRIAITIGEAHKNKLRHAAPDARNATGGQCGVA